MTAIAVRDLHKSYAAHEALRGVSFEIEKGEVFGLLGPNGAGKTTTVEILEGYRRRDSGEVSVLGFDPARAERSFRQRIGVVLQSSSIYPNLTVVENLELFAGYYPRRRSVDEVIGLVGLDEKRRARVRTLSGGQKRRLDLGLDAVRVPDVVQLGHRPREEEPVGHAVQRLLPVEGIDHRHRPVERVGHDGHEVHPAAL